MLPLCLNAFRLPFDHHLEGAGSDAAIPKYLSVVLLEGARSVTAIPACFLAALCSPGGGEVDYPYSVRVSWPLILFESVS